jgi:hypothetical protein
MTDQDAGIGGIVSEIMDAIDQPATDQSAADAISDHWDDSPEAPDATAGRTLEDMVKEFAPVDRQLEMEQSNRQNDEARAQAIAEGMDEQTAQIVYPSFSTPEDMDRFN